MFCPKCGTQLPDDAQFCGSCGTSLVKGEPAAASVTPVAVAGPAPAAAGTAPAAAATYTPSKGVSKRTVAIGLVAIVVIAAVVVAGMLTSWFGLAKDKGTYVVTKQTNYIHGELRSVADIMLNTHGNAVSSTIAYQRLYILGAEYPNATQSVSYNLDEHGYNTHREIKTTSEDGSILQQESIDCENEYDANGALTTQHVTDVIETTNGSNGKPATQKAETVTTAEFHSNGHVKSQTQNAHLTVENGYDPRSCESRNYTSENTSFAEYDENGYVLRTESTQSNYLGSGEAYSSTVDYAWEFDLAGKPTACTVTFNFTDNSGSKKYTFDTDDAGNITTVYDPDGNKTMEYEYKRIDDPSDSIKANNFIVFAWSI